MHYLFVETNFLLKLTFKQEQSYYAYKILRAAEKGKIKLCIPEYCISEAYSVFVDKKREQENLKIRFSQFLTQALRSSHLAKTVKPYKSLELDIDKKLDKELRMLDSNTVRIIKCSDIISHNGDIQKKGILYRRKLVLKDEPDAFIIATIEWYVRNKLQVASETVFLEGDNRTVGSIPEVIEFMRRRKIKLFSNYKNCCAFLKSKGLNL